jgi:hypothetical protein
MSTEARSLCVVTAPRLGSAAGSTMNLRTAQAVRLACRVMAAAGGAATAWLAAGPGPAGPALAVGAATWLALTARHQLRRSHDDHG